MAPSYGEGDKDGGNEGVEEFQNEAFTPSDPLRKYLLLLQDCIAIKFIPLISNHSHLPFTFAFNNNSKTSPSSTPSTIIGDQQSTRPGSSASAYHPGLTLSENEAAHALIESSTAEIDHSLHGLYLYKGFREANLQCFWNSQLHESIRQLEYKGYLVPSTILIWSQPKYLAIVRSAYGRKMLRSPSGYKIEFLGEIEEIVAEPLRQTKFTPLSDSLCRAILDLTGDGREAFVETILASMASMFPGMTLPGRKLVYQTLERLIRERKVYQTANGYFVVTPDTLRYMDASNPHSHHQDHRSQSHVSFSTDALALDSLLTSPVLYEENHQTNNNDKLSFIGRSWGSTEDNSANKNKGNSSDDINAITKCPSSGNGSLKRHNSLKIFRQRDKVGQNGPNGIIGWMGVRSLSLRLSKTKSKSLVDTLQQNKDGNGNGNCGGKLSSKSETTLLKDIKNIELKKNKKEKSFFSKFFSFRKRKTGPRSSRNPSLMSNGPNNQDILNKITTSDQKSSSNVTEPISISTQTSHSNANSNEESNCMMGKKCSTNPNLQTSNLNSIMTRGGVVGDVDVGRYTRTSFTDPEFLSQEQQCKYNHQLLTTTEPSFNTNNNNSVNQRKWNSLPKRPQSRRSVSLLIDDGPLYATPTSPPHTTSTSINNNNNHFVRGESSRCSTLSSIGYGSGSYGIMEHSPSPSVSMNYSTLPGKNGQSQEQRGPLNTYRSYYDFYRRRYPSYISNNGYPSSAGIGSSGSTNGSINRSFTRPQSSQAKWNLYETIGQRQSDVKKQTTEPEIQLKSNEVNSSTAPNQNQNGHTTTVTQNMKSTTNMELELLLPLGKIMGAALRQQRLQQKNGGGHEGGKVSVNLGKLDGAKIKMGQPKNETEIRTTVNHTDGRVETHFESSNEIGSKLNDKSRLEIKTLDPGNTDFFLVNAKTGEEKLLNLMENNKQSTSSSSSNNMSKIHQTQIESVM